MRSHFAAFIAVASLVVAGCATDKDLATPSTALNESAAPTKASPKHRRFELHYETTVKSAPAGSNEVDLWLPVAKDGEFQTVRLTNVSAPAGYKVSDEPVLGNRIFHVRVPAASLPLVVRLDYEVDRAERKTDLAAAKGQGTLPPGQRDRYLAGTALVPVGAKATELSGFQAKGSDPLAIGRESYDYVLSKMRYDKPANSGWGTGSTEWACKEGFGNCTDYHAYFMSITRTHGVPSRFLMGMSIPDDKKEGEIPGYHCWAEFYVDGRGWIPVDISDADRAAEKKPEMVEYYFGGLTADRVELSAGRDVLLVPASKSGPRNFFINPYCEIDGKEAAKDVVVRKVTFKDV